MAFTLDGALWCAALTLRTLVATQGEKGLCITLADLGGAPGMRAPLRVQILSFLCSFREQN